MQEYATGLRKVREIWMSCPTDEEFTSNASAIGRNIIGTMRRRTFLPLALTPLLRGEEYQYGPDSARQPGVPTGKVTKHTWTSSACVSRHDA